MAIEKADEPKLIGVPAKVFIGPVFGLYLLIALCWAYAASGASEEAGKSTKKKKKKKDDEEWDEEWG